MHDDTPSPDDAPAGVPSYALLSERVRRHYLHYYKLVFTDGVLSHKQKEFIALGVSLATGATNCIDGHMKKAVQLGASRAELEEVVAVALGVAAASVVDRADIAHAGLDRRIADALGDALDGPTNEGRSAS